MLGWGWETGHMDRYEQLKQIGGGTYKQVFMAREVDTGEIVAIKSIEIDDDWEFTSYGEIKMSNELGNHPNIVKLKDVVTDDDQDYDYLVFEYMDHDLTGLLRRMRFSAPQIKCYMKQLLAALHHCHLHRVLHCNIKCSNVLINNHGVLKLSNFGLARSFPHHQYSRLTMDEATLWYRAPELLLGATTYGPGVDMWSVGCIFAELLYGGPPILYGDTEPEQIHLIYQLCGVPDEEIWPGVSKLPLYYIYMPPFPLKRRLREVFSHFDEYALDLLDKMLALDPAQRISAKDALDHEYFRTNPLPGDPKSMPRFESSREFNTKETRHETPAPHGSPRDGFDEDLVTEESDQSWDKLGVWLKRRKSKEKEVEKKHKRRGTKDGHRRAKVAQKYKKCHKAESVEVQETSASVKEKSTDHEEKDKLRKRRESKEKKQRNLWFNMQRDWAYNFFTRGR